MALFYRRIEDRILQLPGVVNEGVVSSLPLTGSVGWGAIKVEGYTPPPGQELQVDIRLASTDYFPAMQIPLLKGRFFSAHDNLDSPLVAIIDDRFAQRFWPHENPVGKRLWFDPKKPITIVGVAGIVKQYGLDNEGKIAVYFPHQQQPTSSMFLVTHTSSDVAGLGASIEREIHAVDPNAAVYDIRTMQERLSASLARQRFSTIMLSAFAGFALLLALLGVYSVMSYLVSQSTRDIGVRVALGAQPGNILRLVMRQGVGLVAMGVVGGVAGAIALTRVMASLLFGVTTTDLLTFSSVCLILCIVAFAATIIPAFRATRVDPMLALRDE